MSDAVVIVICLLYGLGVGGLWFVVVRSLGNKAEKARKNFE